MKKIKIFSLISLLFLLASCGVDYLDSPNDPRKAPTSALFNSNVKRMIDATQDTWFSSRFTICTMQYWQQSEYGDEDRYVYRESMRQTQNTLYEIAENFKEIITLNADEETKTEASLYGANENQIAQCRILLAYLFSIMTDTWGDIPYYSFGNSDPDFQALKLSGVAEDKQILTPVYAEQSKINADLLKELEEAEKQINVTLAGIKADNIYNGDLNKWKLFANSLRLRIALKIRGINSTLANQHIQDALKKGVFATNRDNATFKYEASDKNASMLYRAWNVDNRSDFAVSHSFVTLLKGENLVDSLTHVNVTQGANKNPFFGIEDPRIHKYAQKNEDGYYVGMFIAENSAESATFTIESLPGKDIIDKPDFAETLMEYAEVCFIQSELNNWDKSWYEKGIEASMKKWGVSDTDIQAYKAKVPAASKENTLTQKYIALYLQGHTAWMEYRRTGFPKTLIPPFKDYAVLDPKTGKWVNKFFEPLIKVEDIPYRMTYPAQEQTLNGENRKAAVAKLTNGDAITSKLWWDIN